VVASWIGKCGSRAAVPRVGDRRWALLGLEAIQTIDRWASQLGDVSPNTPPNTATISDIVDF
jgi:hypothetical protein